MKKINSLKGLLVVVGIFIFLSLYDTYLNNKIIVLADETYTCTANNIKGMYCSMITDELKQKYGCTIVKDGNTCYGTCTKIAKEDIENYGSILNITVNDCQKNDDNSNNNTNKDNNTIDNTNKDNNTIDDSGKDNVNIDTTGTINNDDVNNPKTGTAFIYFAWIIGLCAIVYSFFYYKNIINS